MFTLKYSYDIGWLPLAVQLTVSRRPSVSISCTTRSLAEYVGPSKQGLDTRKQARTSRQYAQRRYDITR